ncbi:MULTISPECIES: GTP-binding protein [Bacillaceae]|uniref:Cobalamin biosynthesis protein n=1 Tax=Domibacillus aminovorans TaxID=29332 RepID=A0A177KMX6_9BACI|nr:MULTISPECIES: GTP-binding protein [Bacillaceae]OAH54723.1 cobalamin biosynthesis protein [Domibacillus aminovorans]
MKTDLYIIGGFLGSGKTTLLVQLLDKEKKAGRKVAVLMNEIGSMSVDSAMLGEDTAVRDMLNGCICCTIKDEIEVELLTLYKEHHPDVIYIETTGAAHPMEVLDACTSPVIAMQIDVKGIITLVDCARWMERNRLPIAHRKLMEDQARWSDVVALTKADLVSIEALTKIKEEIRSLNEKVVLQEMMFGKMDGEIAFGGGSSESDGGHHAHHHLHVRTMAYEFTNHVPRAEFTKWVTGLPDSVLRIKGFVKFEDSGDRPELFQYAYGVPFFQPQPLKRPSVIVVIGDELNTEQLQQGLERLDGKLF